MKILRGIIQGSPEWHALRARHRCASEAPVMMGCSPHLSRSDLVRMRATGAEREVGAFTQRLFDQGHEAEEAARPILEAELGVDFYRVTATDDEGLHLASFDGLTMDEEEGFEHKLWNVELAEAIRLKAPPPYIFWQLEHQFKVCESLKRIHLVCSNGTREKWSHMVYERVPGRREQLVAGWRQFEDDVAAYQHVEVLPKSTPEPVMALPALAVNVTGEIAIRDNLGLFGEALRAFIERIPKDPKTDQDFANAEHAVKVLQEAQDKLEAAEANALAQTASVDELRRTVAALVDTARATRLALNKLVEAKKASIRADIRQEGVDAVAAHLQMLDMQLGGKRLMPVVQSDFPGAMKGKKTIASLRDAVATEVSRVKIAANEVAGKITLNLNHLRETAGEHQALFADLAQLVLKEPEHFALIVKTRVEAHVKAEAERLERERERIRAEEQAKLQAAPIAVPAAAPAQVAPALSVVSGGKATRPTDDQIVAALALFFRVHESKVIEWLLDMDLTAAEQRMVAAEFK